MGGNTANIKKRKRYQKRVPTSSSDVDAARKALAKRVASLPPADATAPAPSAVVQLVVPLVYVHSTELTPT